MKPKLVESDSIGAYHGFNTILERPSVLDDSDEETNAVQGLETELFSDEMLQESILEMATWDPSASTAGQSVPLSQTAQSQQEDFMSLDGATDQDPKAQMRRLERQVEHLESMQRESGKTIERLAQEVVMAKKTRGTWRRAENDNDMNGSG